MSRTPKLGAPVWRCVALLLTACLALAESQAAVDYVRDIQPLLRNRCAACHGALKQKANLRLDTREFMVKGGKSGAAIVPGKSSEGTLLPRVAGTDPAERMPPEHEGEPLNAAQIQLLTAWIQEGAPAPADEKPESDPKDHWAFRPRTRPAIPSVETNQGGRNPIDAFLVLPRQQAGLTPQPEAPREILIRRLYLDLIGLPPSPREWAAALNDPAPDWYEQLSERLLLDPRHGERWARHWMDIWRYSDGWGLGDQHRNSQKHIWHWREWIVEALNQNLPYDELVRQMLAADELYPGDPDRLRATGFLARNYFLFNRNQWLDETVEHVSKGMLGLTLNCAKCHDHKFDPISQEEFYQLRAVFEPYHARLDMLPGEADLNRDALPRVFDARPETPTYRFVRGQENSPDTHKRIAPGVPAVFTFASLQVSAVPLPPVAYEPSRQPWVLSNHIERARQNLDAGQRSLSSLETQQRTNPAAGTNALEEARLTLQSAQAALAQSRSELASVEARATALRTQWANESRGSTEALRSQQAQAAYESRLRAIEAERDAAIAQAETAIADAQLKLHRASAETRDAAAKELASARDGLSKATAKRALPIAETDTFSPLPGTVWTATRFFDSTKDDPAPAMPAFSTGRRTALARWITDPRNPLTARVAVNHLWNRHFGTPLAPAVFDFGRKSGTPTHAALIDWLACELVDSGWDLRHVHRLILQSAAYRLSSSTRGAEKAMSQDPDNRLWWRRTPIRLEAEVLRDSLLAVSGTLDTTRGGPSIPAGDQAASHRRSLYFYHSNNDRNLFLTTFDAPMVKECYRRDQTIVPQQALALSNSAQSLDASGQIARRIELEFKQSAPTNSPMPENAFLQEAFRRVLGFEPGASELDSSRKALQEWRDEASREGTPTPPDATPDAIARARLVWALLNHSDFVTLR